MYASLANRSTRKLLDYLGHLDVLVVDEMRYLNLRPERTNIFFKLMEERYSRRPTIITTNLDYPEWVNDLLAAHSGLELTSQFRIQAWTPFEEHHWV